MRDVQLSLFHLSEHARASYLTEINPGSRDVEEDIREDIRRQYPAHSRARRSINYAITHGGRVRTPRALYIFAPGTLCAAHRNSKRSK